jgi:ketosteroid isomerase-like protein
MAQTNDSTEQQRNLDAIETLRNQFKAAFVSGEPDSLAPLITDDFVYYQPNYEGPCTYGKQAHLNYTRSLPKVHQVDIKLFDSILMGRWAFESGEELYQEDDGTGGSTSQVARFVRLLYRNDAAEWPMARRMRDMARDQYSFRRPPAATFVCNSGKSQ